MNFCGSKAFFMLTNTWYGATVKIRSEKSWGGGSKMATISTRRKSKRTGSYQNKVATPRNDILCYSNVKKLIYRFEDETEWKYVGNAGSNLEKNQNWKLGEFEETLCWTWLRAICERAFVIIQSVSALYVIVHCLKEHLSTFKWQLCTFLKSNII